jgi:branched-chain amino acid transport system ATP-binding protein
MENLTAGYKKARDIVKGINITIDEGEFVGLFGTNGAGKSTILKSIMGLLYQQEGTIWLRQTAPNKEFLDISCVSPSRRSRNGIKYLTQDAQIFPSFTVEENLLFALHEDKLELKRRITDITIIFPEFQSSAFLNKKGHLLSGGEREKTAIAMVLITRPRLLLLDEPSSGLAPNLVTQLLQGIRAYKQQRGNGMSIILIEQQKLLDAKNICDSLYLLKNGVTVNLEGTPSLAKILTAGISDQSMEEFMLIKT